MTNTRLIAAMVVMTALAPVAGLRSATAEDMQASSAFVISPLSDAELAGIAGFGFGSSPMERIRLGLDRQDVDSLERSAQISRIQMDNWWAQPGAALIDANILASRTAH